jgi:molybdopterin synthase catalytic subunit
MPRMHPPEHGDDWLAIGASELPVADAYTWCVLPSCGAVVLFSGTARDHAEGRPGVTLLEYEAYEDQVIPRFAQIAGELRKRWPTVGRVAMLHRVGPRGEAFEAARYGIDTLKEAAPIWKKETWDGGSDFGLGAQPLTEVGDR